MVWTVQVLVAIACLGAGGAKLIGEPTPLAAFEHIGAGQSFRYVAATVEITGAVLILVPEAATFGLTLLACIMACAVFTHLAIIGGNPMPAAVLLGLNLLVVWLRRNLVSVWLATLNAGPGYIKAARQAGAAGINACLRASGADVRTPPCGHVAP